MNCIVSVYVSTERLERKVFSLPEMREHLISQVPLGRLPTPEDISKVVKFFLLPI